MAGLIKDGENQPGILVSPEKFRLRAGEKSAVVVVAIARPATATVRDENIVALKRYEGPAKANAALNSHFMLFGRRVGTTTIFLSEPGYNRTVTVEVMAAASGWARSVSELRFYPGQRLPGTCMRGALYVFGSDDVRVPATCSPQQAATQTAAPPEPGSYVLGAPTYVSWNLRRNGRPTRHFIHTLPSALSGSDPRTSELLANADRSIFVSQYVRQTLISGRMLQPGTPFEVMKLSEVGPSVLY